MPRVNTATLAETKTGYLLDGKPLAEGLAYQIYNGLDSCLTVEIGKVLGEKLRQSNDPAHRMVYDFERGMQAPALDMMRRGWLVDKYELRSSIGDLQQRKANLERLLLRYTQVIWGRGLNPGSPIQMKQFFYYAPDGLRLPEQHKIEKGVRKVSCDRECLEKLRAYFYAIPIIEVILALRDIQKKIGVLQSEVDNDGRMRTSYNVAGTETGRWSSSENAFGGGTNLQNITPELRRIFISDPGYKLCYLDLEQAESRVVGLLVWMCVGDSSYIEACESGDLHTTVAKLTWPALEWTDDPKACREIADRVFYRQFTHRDMAKRGGHGTNYYGTPRTMARHLKVEESVVQTFQHSYFRAFPGIQLWHTWVAGQLGMHQYLTTPLGRKRHFFGRPGDDATLREAIAFVPQSVVGDLLNYALWRVWRYLPEVQLLGQVHDAIVFQYREEDEAWVMPRAIELTTVPFTVRGIHPGNSRFPCNTHLTRTLTIPSECEIGWNWAKDTIKTSLGKKLKNPDGLIKWRGEPDGRKRHEGIERIIG